jgi:hypothetical protein
MEFEATESFHTDLEGTWIVREGSRYFVIIPQKWHYQTPENQRIDVVALDPGMRTFIAFYSEVLHGKIEAKRNILVLEVTKLRSKQSIPMV